MKMCDCNQGRLPCTCKSEPAEQHQDEPVAWSPIKPSTPGAYWLRGNGLDQDALIQVIDDQGELRCNLHQRTTEADFGWGYAVSDLSEEFEWLGPLYTHPAPAVQKGEPVAYADPKAFENFKNLAWRGGSYAQEWMWAKSAPGLVPLYTHADAGEVERLRKTLELVREQRDNELRTNSSLEQERDTMRAQLAERDALLREVSDSGFMRGQIMPSHEAVALQERVETALSGSAEPSAPVADCTNEDAWNCKYCRKTESCAALERKP